MIDLTEIVDFITRRTSSQMSQYSVAEAVCDLAQAVMERERAAHIEVLRKRRDDAMAATKLQAKVAKDATKSLRELGAPGRPVVARKPRKAKEQVASAQIPIEIHMDGAG